MYDVGCMITHLTLSPPPPPGISNLVWHPLERLSPSKTLLHYTIMRKMIVPTIKRKKILLFMLTQHLIISILPCKDLSQLMTNSKAPRNLEAITYTTQMMPSKEPVRFKQNTEARVGFLYLSFLETPPPRGGYSRNFWVGMCRWDPGTLNIYQSKFS